MSNGAVVRSRIAAEVEAGRLLGPVPHLLAATVHVSPIGLVPIAHQAGKWRMIMDLSSPAGRSVNDGISPVLSSLVYASVDDAVRCILRLGLNAELVKLDLKDAYRLVPVHSDDHCLLGVLWDGHVYVDRALPFGLRSAPKVFSAWADFLAWALYCRGISNQLHYLDDFLLMGSPYSGEGATALSTALQVFQALGVPVAAHKTEGPSTTVTFLGVLIDTSRFELRLPADKLTRLQGLLREWLHKRSATRKELESLLGHLSHAATVIRAGRPFLRQLFSLLSVVRAPHHFIRLNVGARADLAWWRCFLRDWNGSSFFPAPTPSFDVVSDASGSFGCGAFSQHFGWFQFRWPVSWQSVGIAAKELAPIVMAAAIWGRDWGHHCVRFQSDNMAVVEILKKRASKEPLLMHLMRCLLFYSAFFSFEFVSEHIPGVLNTAADAISRNNLPLFLSLVPQIPRVFVPQSVVDLLISRRPDWGSHDWTSLFCHSLRMVSPPLPCCPTNLAGGATQVFVRHSTSPPPSHRISSMPICGAFVHFSFLPDCSLVPQCYTFLPNPGRLPGSLSFLIPSVGLHFEGHPQGLSGSPSVSTPSGYAGYTPSVAFSMVLWLCHL